MSKRYDRVAAQASVDHIKRLAAENAGKAPTWAVQAAASKLGVSTRSIWTWLADGIPEPPAEVLNTATEQAILTALAAAHGRRKC